MAQIDELGHNRNVRSQEFAHNRTLYNRVQSIRSKLIFFYIAPLAVYLPAAIFMGILSYVVAGALDALIVVPIAAYLAWKGCYRYHDFSLMALIGVLVMNQLLLMFLSPYENKLFYDFNIFGTAGNSGHSGSHQPKNKRDLPQARRSRRLSAVQRALFRPGNGHQAVRHKESLSADDRRPQKNCLRLHVRCDDSSEQP